MNRRSVIFLLLSTSLCIGACEKKQDADTPYTRIQGNWKLAKTATDDNGDRQIGIGETHTVSPLQDYEITFNKDYTGVENDVYNGVAAPPLKFDWAIVGKDSVWCGFEGHDTLTYYLVGVSSGTLTLQTDTKYGLVAYYYNKK